jgi:hypothetical protein
MRLLTIPSLALLTLASGCQAPGGGLARLGASLPDETELWGHSGWMASLLHEDAQAGVWGVAALQIFPQYGSPEVVVLDEAGRCLVLVSSAGSWNAQPAVTDGAWLAPLAHADVDPELEGPELYVAGKRGIVYQVVGHKSGALDARVVAEVHGYEIHALVAGELDPSRPGPELLAFTVPGGLCLLRPAAGRARFDVEWLQELPARVREALVLPAFTGGGPLIATVSRAGRLELLQLGPEGPRWQLVHAEPTDFTGLAMRPLALGPEAVLYTTTDDGRVLRHQKDFTGRWQAEILHVGAPGARGLVAGRLSEDPAAECLAYFTRNGEVVLLERGADGWKAETIFVDRDRGWRLALAELDGRNGTPEILCAGYSGRVVLLARPPGYGLRGLLAPPPDLPASGPRRAP